MPSSASIMRFGVPHMQQFTRRVLFLRITFLAISSLIIPTEGWGQQDPGVTWAVLASGGVNDAASERVHLSSTIGQPIIGATTDPETILSQGFWFPLRLLSSAPFEPKAPNAPFALRNYPNPFTVLTTISYRLDDPSAVTLEVVDLAGRKVATLATGQRREGEHRVEWNGLCDGGEPAPAGIYVYTLTVRSVSGRGSESISRQKMMLVR